MWDEEIGEWIDAENPVGGAPWGEGVVQRLNFGHAVVAPIVGVVADRVRQNAQEVISDILDNAITYVETYMGDNIRSVMETAWDSGVGQKRVRADQVHSAKKEPKVNNVLSTSEPTVEPVTMAPRKSSKMRKRARGGYKRTGGKRRRAAKRPKSRKKVSKRKRTRAINPGLHGAQKKIEYGLQRTAAKTVYVGHSTDMRQVTHQVFWQCVMRAALRAAGTELRALTDFCQCYTRLTWFRSTDSGSPPQNDDVNMTSQPVSNAYLVAQAMYTAVESTATQAGWPDFIVDSLELHRAAPSSGTLMARINLRNMIVEIANYSHLTMQNQTQGITATAADVGSADAVSRNPLIGVAYDTNSGGLIPVTRPETAIGTYNGFTPDAGGRILPQADLDVEVNLKNYYAKPPGKKHFRKCKGYSKVSVYPGSVKDSKLFHRYRTTAAGFMMSQRRVIVELGYAVLTSLDANTFGSKGKSRLIALERVIDTRVASEPTIILGCQFVAHSSCALVGYKKNWIPTETLDL